MSILLAPQVPDTSSLDIALCALRNERAVIVRCQDKVKALLAHIREKEAKENLFRISNERIPS